MATCVTITFLTPPPRPEQVTDQLGMNWRRLNIFSNLGDRWYKSVVFWWLAYSVVIGLLESRVADAEAIECSFRNSVGLWAAMCGPLRVIDVMGGGKFYAESIKGVLPTMASSTELQETLQSFIDSYAKGPKNNIGFFNYEDGDDAAWAERFTAAILATRHYQEQHIPCDAPTEVNNPIVSP